MSGWLQLVLLLPVAAAIYLVLRLLIRLIFGPDSITDTDDFWAGHARPNTGSDE